MKSKVYFAQIKDTTSEKLILDKIPLLFKSVGVNRLIKKDKLVALKLHFGEKRESSPINPKFVKEIVGLVKKSGGKPFLTDTNTLYVGQRSNAVDHLMNAYHYGFSIETMGAPVIIGDGLLGENQISTTVASQSLRMVHLSGIAKTAEVIIGLAHITGHILTGYGGNLKNIGMGFAGRGGKLAQHSGMTPKITLKKCQGCETCLEWCPADAISIRNEKAVINTEKCYGCGECFALCPYQAIEIQWDETSPRLQEKMAEYCYAILKNKPAAFFNFALGMTKDCDCMGKTSPLMTSDFGILASSDPVAIDSAAIELINKEAGEDVFKKHYPNVDYTIQLKHAQQLGLGSMDYSIEMV